MAKKQQTPEQKSLATAKAIHKLIGLDKNFFVITSDETNFETFHNMKDSIEILGSLEFAKADFLAAISNQKVKSIEATDFIEKKV